MVGIGMWLAGVYVENQIMKSVSDGFKALFGFRGFHSLVLSANNRTLSQAMAARA
jgi:hypothetical protein